MSLKQVAFDRLTKKILKCENRTPICMLICDEYSLGVLSSVCKMNDIIDSGVASVEMLNKSRQPLKMDAIYFISPTEANIKRVIKDFESVEHPLYSAAHIFFTSHVDQELIDYIKNSNLIKRLKTFSESYIDFFTNSPNVFTTDCKTTDSYSILYGAANKDLDGYLEKLGQQLAYVCITLNCKPLIVSQKNSDVCCKLVSIVSEKLKCFDVINNSSDNPTKPTTLILLDRSYDGMTPLLHDLTFQAMAADIRNNTDNIYVYKNLNGAETTSFLDESNELWSQLAFKHIADVLKLVPAKLKELASQNKMKLPTNKGSLQDLKVMLSKLPQYKAELNKYQVILDLAGFCYDQYESRKLENLCAIEQDIATGSNQHGEPVTDPVGHMLPILQGNYSTEEKLRVILLYALSKKDGLIQDNLEKIIEHGKLKNDKAIFSKFNKIHLKVMEADNVSNSIHRPQEFTECAYSLSRFVPPLKTIMKEVIAKKVSSKEFVEVTTSNNGGGSDTRSANSGGGSRFQFGRRKPDTSVVASKANDNRVMVFVVGGLTFSEIRCAHEVGVENHYDTVIGSTQLLTPEIFIKNISKL